MTIQQLLYQEQLHEFMEASEDFTPIVSQIDAPRVGQRTLYYFASMPEYIKAKARLQAAVKDSERERIGNIAVY